MPPTQEGAVASLGDLERAVMELLWSDGPLTATELRDGLAGRGLALTTVHTVLSRLEQKGFVVHDEARPRRFRARASREEHAAELMHEVLGQAADRQAVLARFVGSVSGDEARLLRALLDAADAEAGVAIVGPDDGAVRP
jgi:predicted transcriptional regulator